MKLLFLFLTLFISLTIDAQVTVYITEDDYPNKAGVVYEDYSGWTSSGSNVTIVLLDKGNKVKLKCADIWGFVYKDKLFRVDKFNNQPVMLLHQGNACVYRPGCSALSELKNPTAQFVSAFEEAHSYISHSLSTPVIPIRGWIDETKTEIGRFRAEHPEHEKLLKCAYVQHLGWSWEVLEDCAQNMDKK